MKISDYIIYDKIHKSTTGSGSSGSGGGCVTLIGISFAVILFLAWLPTIRFEEIAAFLIMIFIPPAGIAIYIRFKKLINKIKNDDGTETAKISDFEFITIAVLSIVLFFVVLFLLPSFKGVAIHIRAAMSAPEILQEYGIEDTGIKVKTYTAAVNSYTIEVYFDIPQEANLSYNEKMELLDRLNKIVHPVDGSSNCCLYIGDNIYYISYAVYRHLETESYETYDRFLKYVYRFGKY